MFVFQGGILRPGACFLVKDIMNEYSSQGDDGIVTFIHLSNALDCVGHFVLGKNC